jgi:hypothetical protein
VRCQTTPAFEADYRRLTKRERTMFRRVLVEEFSLARDAFRATPSTPFPDRLRVKAIVAAQGLFEMTWSFAGPDGRATFEWIDLDGEPAIRWRRVGGHRILTDLRG